MPASEPLVSVAAKASTTSVQVGNNCRPGTASTARATKSGQRKPSTAKSTMAVTASNSHCPGGNSATPKPSASDSTAVKRAHRHRGNFHTSRRFWIRLLCKLALHACGVACENPPPVTPSAEHVIQVSRKRRWSPAHRPRAKKVLRSVGSSDPKRAAAWTGSPETPFFCVSLTSPGGAAPTARCWDRCAAPPRGRQLRLPCRPFWPWRGCARRSCRRRSGRA